MQWHDYIPLVNILADFFNGTAPPTLEQLSQVLSTISIVSALLLAVAASFMTGVDFQELQDALARFSFQNDTSWSYCSQATSPSAEEVPLSSWDSANGARCQRIREGFNGYAEGSKDWLDGTNKDQTGAGNEEVYTFAQNITWSTSFLSISLLTSVVLYVFMISTSFLDQRGDYSGAMMLAWWRIARVPVATSVAMTCLGVVFFYNAVDDLVAIKFPSWHMEVYGQNDITSMRDPLGQMGGLWNRTMYAFICITLALLSWAHVSKTRAFVDGGGDCEAPRLRPPRHDADGLGV